MVGPISCTNENVSSATCWGSRSPPNISSIARSGKAMLARLKNSCQAATTSSAWWVAMVSSGCAPELLAVVEQLVQRRLGRDRCVNLLGAPVRVPGADGPTVGAQDCGLARVEVDQQPGEVVGFNSPPGVAEMGVGRCAGTRAPRLGGLASLIVRHKGHLTPTAA